jgi:hypothetical protein
LGISAELTLPQPATLFLAPFDDDNTLRRRKASIHLDANHPFPGIQCPPAIHDDRGIFFVVDATALDGQTVKDAQHADIAHWGSHTNLDAKWRDATEWGDGQYAGH